MKFGWGPFCPSYVPKLFVGVECAGRHAKPNVTCQKFLETESYYALFKTFIFSSGVKRKNEVDAMHL